MNSIIAKKVGMTRVFNAQGQIVPVTVLHVSPNYVVSIKTKEKDGYNSTVIGYEDIAEKKLSKPVKGQFTKNNLSFKRKLIELRNECNHKIGSNITIDQQFKIGDFVDIQGTTRGHGFTGAIKLWNFSCGPRSHGAGWPHRFQGSIETGRGGSSAQRVFKGKKMSGRYGNETVSMVNLEIIAILPEENLVLVKGSVPGRRKSILRIKTTTRKLKQSSKPFVIVMNKEEITNVK